MGGDDTDRWQTECGGGECCFCPRLNVESEWRIQQGTARPSGLACPCTSHRAHADTLERLPNARGLRGRVRLCGAASGKLLAKDLVLLFEVRVQHRQVLLRLLPHLRIPVRVPALLAASDLCRDLGPALLGDPETQVFVVPTITVESNGVGLSTRVS